MLCTYFIVATAIASQETITDTNTLSYLTPLLLSAIIALFMTIIASYLKPLLDRILAHFSATRRAKKEAKGVRQRAIFEALVTDPQKLNRFQWGGTMLLLMAIFALSMAGFFLLFEVAIYSVPRNVLIWPLSDSSSLLMLNKAPYVLTALVSAFFFVSWTLFLAFIIWMKLLGRVFQEKKRQEKSSLDEDTSEEND